MAIWAKFAALGGATELVNLDTGLVIRDVYLHISGSSPSGVVRMLSIAGRQFDGPSVEDVAQELSLKGFQVIPFDRSE